MTHGGDINFGSLFTVCRTRLGVIGAQFALEGVTAKSVFLFLTSHAARIDEAFDCRPLWRCPEGSQTALVEVRRPARIESTHEWATCFSWLRSQLEALQLALWPFLGRRPTVGRPRQWDELLFLAEMRRYNPWVVDLARSLVDCSDDGLPVRVWGKGGTVGTVSLGFRWQGREICPLTLKTDGTFVVNFLMLAKEPPLDRVEVRLSLLQRLNDLLSVELPSSVLVKRPVLPLAMLQQDSTRASLLETLSWTRELVRAA